MNHPTHTDFQTVQIAHIEQAINVWRNRAPAPEGVDEVLTLCPQARALADLYGEMIFGKLASVPASSLSSKQLAALNEALV
ncbi:DUF3717 domain-containing protein [Paraburkholderia gardini]|uniref:DUF3717 domain-containing protein n=1 Tax=Paraburkholderia gardini TaxID=2823469 RepID=UPI001D61ED92|nr:DUF3717 domain-containing protein [Paraburkholderia gardini]CAG4925254.1 hypothetical protein R69919_05288 [Paraburkholderia gardini]